jgi:integrase
MRGSVVKDTRGKAVRYFVVIEEKTNDGKRRRRWHTDPVTGSTFTNKRAAEAYCAKLIDGVGTGVYVPPAKETLDSWLDAWLGIMKPNLKPSTYASYERVLRVHVRPRLGATLLRKISGPDLDRLYTAMLASGRADYREGEPLSPRTVRYAATILTRALKDATRKGLIPRNPAEQADAPRAGKTSPGAEKSWSATDLHRFLDATAEDYYGPAWAFLASTGCRRGEALGLRWSDLDLDAKRASLVQSVQKVDGKVVFGEVKTSASRRRIALDDDTVTMLKTQRKSQAEQRLLMGPAWVDHDLVFTGATGEPFYPETVTRTFHSTIRRLGLPPITLHGLRHTWASLALEAGIHAKVVQERLGHANVGITLNIYSHVAPVMHEDAAELVADLVRRAKR